MKKTILSFLFFTVIIFNASAQKAYTEEMKTELKNRFKIDQACQVYDMKRMGEKVYIDSMNQASRRIFKENCEVVKAYFKEYSIPFFKDNGKEISSCFWIIVQHADHDVAFQEEVLKVMKKERDVSTVTKRNYAYLYDRVKKNQGKPQLYGTQVSWATGSAAPYSLEKPEQVNDRRKKMELEPIEAYLKSFYQN